MRVRILSLIEGARAARGTAVMIDVFRSSTTMVAAFAAGAERIIPVGELAAAYELKRENPSFLLFGERGGLPAEGFDSGNSPAAVARMDLRGKTIIFTTSAGTQGIVSAVQAGEILIGGFVNARAVADYVIEKQPTDVSLLAMGVAGVKPALEDELCAEYIRALILGEPADHGQMVAAIMKDPEALKFLDKTNPVYNPDDVHLSLRANVYSIVPRYEKDRGHVGR